MSLKYFALFAVVSICWSVPAQSKESLLCEQALAKPSYLQGVGIEAEKAKKAICFTKSQIEKNFAYVDFVNNIKGWFDPYGGFEGGGYVVDAIKSHITIANPSVAVDLNLKDNIQVVSESFKPSDESKCVLVSSALNCAEVLEDFIQLYGGIQNLEAERRRRETLEYLKKLRVEWTPFLEHMKGQTWLELAINRRAYKNDSSHFKAPPSSQWIFLHPTLLVEYAAGAADGENAQEALGLEIIGMNWWKQDKWYVPSGASVLAVYSDRSDIKDLGYGVALHFLSDYTVGYTNHDGEDAYFLSVDLIKLFQDKNKAFDSYRSAFD
jgi:hypothetical protein